MEEERPKPGAATSTQPIDVGEESSESVALTNANGEPITNVSLDEDPEQLNVNYDGSNVGIAVTESGGLQVTEVTEIVTPRPPPLQPAPSYLMSKTRAANEDRYKYKSLAGNPEPITVVSSSNPSLASPIGTVTVAETSSREDFDQSIIQQAMETMNPSSGAEAKPLMPVIYYKCKDSNQIFSVPVTHEQAINIAAGKAEYRPDLGKVVPMNNNEGYTIKDDKSSLPPSRSATPMSGHEARGEIDIRSTSPAYSDHSVRTSASLEASSAAEQQRQQDRRNYVDEKRYDLNIVDDDDDEIEIEIQTDEAGNIISTNAETLLKKVGSGDNDNANDITKNSTNATNPITPSTTSHIQTIPRRPILYNAAHIQHSNQDSYASRSSISHEYNTATDYQNPLTVNTGSAFQTVTTTQQQQQPLLNVIPSVSTHSIACGDDPVDVVVGTSTPEPKPQKESRTIAIQTSPTKDASNDNNEDDNDRTAVGIQTQTSPNRQITDHGSDSNDDDVIVVESGSTPEVTEGSNSEIPTSWIVHDTVYPLYAFQVHYNEAMWQACGLNMDTDIQLLISDDSDDTATHPSPDTLQNTSVSPAEVTHGKPKVTSSPAGEEHSVTKSTAVDHTTIANDTAEKNNENYIYDHANNEVTINGTMSAVEVTQEEPPITNGSVTSPPAAEHSSLTNDKTEMSNENNNVISYGPDRTNNEGEINRTMEICNEDDSQVADDEGSTLQNTNSMETEQLGVECSSTKENQCEIEKNANNHQKDASNLGDVFESVTPLTNSVTPITSKVDAGPNEVTVDDVEDDRSTSPDSIRLTRSPVYRQRTLGIFSRKNIKFGGTSLRIKLKAPKFYADDTANDADAEDDDYDEFDDDYDDDDEDDDDDIDPPEYPSFTRTKSREEKMSEQQQTDDGTETEPGDEGPNSEGWESEFADENDDGDVISSQSIPKSSETSQGVKEKQVIKEKATTQTDKQYVTIVQAPQGHETPQIDEQEDSVGQISEESETPQVDEQRGTVDQASQESETINRDEHCVADGQPTQENATPQPGEQGVTLEQESQESVTPEMDGQGVTMIQVSQENLPPQTDELGVVLEQASQESETPQPNEQDVTLEQESQESETPQPNEQDVTLEQESQENTASETEENGVTSEQALEESATPQTDQQASQEAVLHLSQLASVDLDPKNRSLNEMKPLQDENSPESNEGKDENKELKEEMKTQSLPASPYPKEVSQVS